MSELHSNTEEKGFALVLTITILMGMLIIILPLVKINNQRITESHVANDDMRARFGEEVAEGMLEYLARNSTSSQKPIFMQQFMVPGWDNIPVRLHPESAKKGYVGVRNIYPVFLQLAEHVGDVKQDVTANKKENIPVENENTILWKSYRAVGKELLMRYPIWDKYPESSGKVLRGTVNAGTLSSHKKGDPVYAVKNKTFLGVVRYRGNWYDVTDLAFNYSLSGHVYTNPKITKVIGHSPLEYYPFRPFFDPTEIYTEISIDIVDENSKFNINSITKDLAATLGLDFDNTFSAPAYPFKTPSSFLDALKVRPDNNVITQAMPQLTTYSEPAISFIGKPSLYGINSSLQDNALYLNNENQAAYGSGGKKVFQHHINFNTASVLVMANALAAMGVNDPFKEANRIEGYRAGTANKTLGSPLDLVNTENLDGREDPFDGFAYQKDQKYFGSAQEEFLALFNGTTYDKVSRHVYAWNDVSGAPPSGGIKSVPISFETSEVKTAHISVGVTRNGRPTANRKKSIVFQRNYDPYGKIILDHNHGWNLHASHFNGVDWQPVHVKDVKNKEIKINSKNGPVAPSMLGLTGGGEVVTKYVSKLNGDYRYIKYITGGFPGPHTIQDSYKNNLNTSNRGYPAIEFGIRVKPKPWTDLFDPGDVNTDKDPFNDPSNPGPNGSGQDTEEGMEPYYLSNNASYETVLFRPGAKWTSIQWDIRKGFKNPISVSINGGSPVTGSASGSYGRIEIRKTNANVTSDYLRLTFDLSKHQKNSPSKARDGNAGTKPSKFANDEHLWSCPQLFRVIVKFEYPNASQNQELLKIHDVR